MSGLKPLNFKDNILPFDVQKTNKYSKIASASPKLYSQTLIQTARF